jgi:hypothetical protein
MLFFQRLAIASLLIGLTGGWGEQHAWANQNQLRALFVKLRESDVAATQGDPETVLIIRRRLKKDAGNNALITDEVMTRLDDDLKTAYKNSIVRLLREAGAAAQHGNPDDVLKYRKEAEEAAIALGRRLPTATQKQFDGALRTAYVNSIVRVLREAGAAAQHGNPDRVLECREKAEEAAAQFGRPFWAVRFDRFLEQAYENRILKALRDAHDDAQLGLP